MFCPWLENLAFCNTRFLFRNMSQKYSFYPEESIQKNISYFHNADDVYRFGAGIIFLILAHTVYKMWIIQEPNTLELWNKLHFEGGKNGEYIPCLKHSVPIFFLSKYIKCNV